MQKDIYVNNYVIAPAPKSARGAPSTLEASQDYLLYFNGNSLILFPLAKQKQFLTIYHSTEVTAAKFSHDGRLVASIEAKGTLIISEICPTKIITVNQFQNFYPQAKSIDWTADRKRVCVVGDGKNSFGRVASVETGINVGQIAGVAAALNSCSFRPERPFKLVLGGDEHILKFFEGPPFKFVKSDKSHTGFVNQVKYSPKGGFILSGGADRKLVLYDGIKQEKLGERENAHGGGIFGLDWIDEDHFVTCSSDKLIKVWNLKFEELFVLEAGTPEQLKNPKNINLFFVAVRVVKDKIFAVNLEGDILAFKNPLIQYISQPVQKISGPRSKPIKLLGLNETYFIILDNGGRILLSNLKTGQTDNLGGPQIKTIIDGFIESIGDSRRLYVLLGDNNVAVFEGSEIASSWKFVARIEKIQAKNIAGFAANQFVGFNNNQIFIYDIVKDDIVKGINFNEEATAIQSYKGFIAVGTLKAKIHLFNQNLELLGVEQLRSFKISNLSFVPNLDGQSSLMFAGDSCGNLKVLRVGQKQFSIERDTIGGHNSLISSVSYDNTHIYTFSMDGKINVWSREGIKRLSEILNIAKGGITYGISSGSNLIVTGGDLITRVISKA